MKTFYCSKYHLKAKFRFFKRMKINQFGLLFNNGFHLSLFLFVFIIFINVYVTLLKQCSTFKKQFNVVFQKLMLVGIYQKLILMINIMFNVA